MIRNDLRMLALAAAASAMQAPGGRSRLAWNSDRPRSFQSACPAPGHAEAGVAGTPVAPSKEKQ